MIFYVVRATAINLYAEYEQSLHMVYAHLLRIEPDWSGVTFFRLNNARARLDIVERLLKKRHGDTYNHFWNSLKKHLRRLDEVRNQIVHWTIYDQTQGGKRFMALIRPNFWDIESWANSPYVGAAELYDFMERAEFFTRLLNAWLAVLRGDEHVPEPWRQMCQQLVPYPPPSTHPLYRKPRGDSR